VAVHVETAGIGRVAPVGARELPPVAHGIVDDLVEDGRALRVVHDADAHLVDARHVVVAHDDAHGAAAVDGRARAVAVGRADEDALRGRA